MADDPEAKGNDALYSGDFTSAIRYFTEAICLAPTNHTLFTNRSAAHESLHNYADALSDAKKTVELKPDWPKGYSRLGAAYLGLGVAAYKKGLKIELSNQALKSELADAQGSATPNPFGDAFKGPEMWTNLTADPSTRDFLQQPDFVNMMQEIQKSPSNFNLFWKDQRVMQSLGVLLNVKFRPPAGDEAEVPESDMSQTPREEPELEKKQEPEPESEPMFTEDKEKEERKQKAKEEKALGNAAYKKRDLETAMQHYSTAMEIDDEDISYITNRAAVYLEMRKYDECIKDCEKAVERGRELRSDCQMIARALTRKGTALTKMAKCSKDYEPAIEAFQDSLTEHTNQETSKKLNEAEKAKKQWEEKEYFDPEIGEEEREKGYKFFKEHKYNDAIKYYTEAIKRNPKDALAYCNRAACYTILMRQGLKDAKKCIELEPTFSRGYSRKAAIEFFKNEYDNALVTYQQGLEHDYDNPELLDGVRRCVQQIIKANREDLTPEELNVRQAKGMENVKIQNILKDPLMRRVLSDLQKNPNTVHKHLKNPTIMDNILKLISAGIRGPMGLKSKMTRQILVLAKRFGCKTYYREKITNNQLDLEHSLAKLQRKLQREQPPPMQLTEVKVGYVGYEEDPVNNYLIDLRKYQDTIYRKANGEQLSSHVRLTFHSKQFERNLNVIKGVHSNWVRRKIVEQISSLVPAHLVNGLYHFEIRVMICHQRVFVMPEGYNDKRKCAICFEPLWNGLLSTKFFQCAHFFHNQCIQGWIIKKGWNSECPVCQSLANQPERLRNKEMNP